MLRWWGGCGGTSRLVRRLWRGLFVCGEVEVAFCFDEECVGCGGVGDFDVAVGVVAVVVGDGGVGVDFLESGGQEGVDGAFDGFFYVSGVVGVGEGFDEVVGLGLGEDLVVCGCVGGHGFSFFLGCFLVFSVSWFLICRKT